MEAKKYSNFNKMIHVSTDEVYGPLPKPMEATEQYMLNPTSPYSASKASADLLLMSYYKTYRFPVSIVRPCNNYGTHQYPEKLIPMVITQLLKDEKAPVHGGGYNIREWIHVEDCCRAIIKLLPIAKAGQIYNIGSGMRHSNLAIISSVIYLMKRCRGSQAIKHTNFVTDRPGNDLRYALNSNKLLSTVGDYVTHKNMLHKLEEIIEWYSKNTDWWDNVDVSCNFHSEGYLR
jgi:dTDP-glucose 4,6-dehydratase